MYDIFLGLSKISAPFIPFITEEIYLNLRTNDMPESVHLCDYLKPDEKQVDEQLEKGMEQIRKLVEIGRALRSKTGIKVRCPLHSATIVCSKEIENSLKDLLDLLNEEINVKNISFARDTTQFMTKAVKPNYSRIGPKLKEKAKAFTEKIESLDKSKLYEELVKNKKIVLDLKGEKIQFTKEDFEIVEKEKEHFARDEVEGMILFLDTTLTPELEAEGFAREIVRRIQSMRKELDLNVEDKISTEIKVDSEQKKALKRWEDYIKKETRSKKITYVDKPTGKLVKKWEIDELLIEIGISK
jgi:isoleucyl-tRNA synthetase